MNGHSPSHPTPGRGADQVPRTGRRADRAEALRGRLIDAAESLVAEQQASAVTARDIARRAGVSDGVLYNHFADKHELVVAALLRRFGRLVDTFRAELPSAAADAPADAPPASLQPGLERLVGASFRLHAAALPMLANVLSEPALFHRFMVEMHRPPFGSPVFMDPIEAHLRAEREAGRTNADVDPHAATALLIGAVLLLALQDLVAPRPAEAVEASLQGIVRTLVAGIAPSTAPRRAIAGGPVP